MVVRKFRKLISEGQTFVVLAILFALLTRLTYYFAIDSNTTSPIFHANGLLWPYIENFLQNNIGLSFWLSTLCVGILAAQAYLINTKHVLIREKTTLTMSLMLLLFSFSTGFYTMNVHYITAISILVTISSLFSAYNADHKQPHILNASISLVVASLFDISILLYIPALWAGIMIVRSFSPKTFLITLFSLFIVYIPVASYYLLTRDMEAFYKPFLTLGSGIISDFPAYHYSTLNWVSFLVTGGIFVLVFVNNYINGYKDKIRIRAYNTVLGLLIVYSTCAFMLIAVNTASFQFVSLAISALVLAHFYALAEERWKMGLFFVHLGIYLIVCLFNLGTMS